MTSHDSDNQAGDAASIRVRRPVRIWLIVETILAIPAALLGGFAAIMSPMMFDAPGSTGNPQLVVMFLSVIAFPVLCVFAVVSAWIAFAYRADRIALWLSLLPALPLIGGAVALLLF